MLKGVQLHDLSVPSSRIITDSGQMIVEGNIARTGVQIYTASQLGLADENPNKLIEVHREEKDVFCQDSISSYRSVPVTVGHPSENVTPENAKQYSVGTLEGVPARDEDYLKASLVLADKEGIQTVEDGTVELSAGYTCDIEIVDEGGDLKYYQRNIRANHVAIVEKGRAGSACRISDDGTVKVSIGTIKGLMDRFSVELGDQDFDQVLGALEPKTIEVEKEVIREVEVSDESTQAVKDQLDSVQSQLGSYRALCLDEDNLAESFKSLVKQSVEVADYAQSIDLTLKSDDLAAQKREIVEAVRKVDLSDKSDEYINASFDIIKEGTGIHIPLEMKDEEAPKDPVAEARQRMIKTISKNKG